MQPGEPLRRILVNPVLRLLLRAETGHDLSSTVRPLRNYTFTEADLVFFDRK
jgi:hypothetical protein